MKTIDILILGGGASGLAAAVAVKKSAPNLHVVILEHNARVGKKLLATGNGRCNLGNCQSHNSAYYGTVTPILPEVFAETESAEAFFRSMGLFCRQDADGRLYPKSNQASAVLDTLRFTCELSGVNTICDCHVTAIKKCNDRITVETTCGTLSSRTVICASGGMAASKTGSDGSIFALLQTLGHKCTTLTPALVPFETNSKLTNPLKGTRITAVVSAYSSTGQCLCCERGEVQFNEHTISGICVMNLSAKCAECNPAYLSLNLLPDYTTEKVTALLWELYAVRANWRIGDFLTGLFPQKVKLPLLHFAGIALPQDAMVYQLLPQQLEHLAICCQDWRFPITGRCDWQDAQVTAGGIPLTEIDERLQSRIVSGLFFAGEILDIHGICGGYNLDWAWHSGQYTAHSAIQYLTERKLT